jgi:hypothetical protein
MNTEGGITTREERVYEYERQIMRVVLATVQEAREAADTENQTAAAIDVGITKVLAKEVAELKVRCEELEALVREWAPKPSGA